MDVWKVPRNHYDCPEHNQYSGFDNFNTCNMCHYFWARWQEDWEATINSKNGIEVCDCETCK